MRSTARISLAITVLLLLASMAAHATTYYNMEQMSGWKGCSSCTNSGSGAYFSMTQYVKSPSLNGASTKFYLGSGGSLSDALWYRRMSYSSSPTNFSYTVHYYMTSPWIPTGLEMSTSEMVGSKWYRMDYQCSFYFKVWRTWNASAGSWSNTSVPCNRPSAYAWTTVNFQGHRANGKMYFDTITINGHKYYVNHSSYPKYMGGSSNWVTVHFQLNGNKSQTPFSVWGNEFQLTDW